MCRNFVYFLFIILFSLSVYGQENPYKTNLKSSFIKGEMEGYNLLFHSPDYARSFDEGIDITYYELNLHINDSLHYLIGKVAVEANVVKSGQQTMQLDLMDNMIVDSVQVGGIPVSVVQNSSTIDITLNKTYEAGELITAVIWYQGLPQSGGSFSNSFSFSSHSGVPWIWSLSQPYGAHYWWPCRDHPSDKADSVDIIVTCDSIFKVGSNGYLVSVTNNGDGTSTHHWKTVYPIATYLISIALTDYVEFSDWYHYSPTDSMEVLNYVLSQSLGSAQAILPKTVDMLHIFSSLYGEYPFVKEKYGHAQIRLGGGMEHQTMTSIGVFRDQENLIAHELSHQWFGDMITCKIWPDLWLNEGFATYSEALYLEQQYGTGAYWDRMNSAFTSAKSAVGTVYLADTVNIGSMFRGELVYNKGACVLHMLRKVLGDSIFFSVLFNYANDPKLKYGTAATADFQSVCELTAGMNLDFFFDQWIYGEKYPNYSYTWTTVSDTGGYSTGVTISQTTGTSNPSFFTMPVDLKFVSGTWDTVATVWNDAQNQTFHIQLSHLPTEVLLDADNWILKSANIVGIEENVKTFMPMEFSLLQNFPNPFNSTTQIDFSLKQAGMTRLTVYNILGQEISRLLDGYCASGNHRVVFNANELSSGTYTYCLTTTTGSIVKKMILIR